MKQLKCTSSKVYRILFYALHTLENLAKNQSTYHLTGLWIFMHKRRASDVVPHLARCHCKNDGLLARK